ncbi:MAG: hypothetical protein CMH27_00170 [Micavibrio sp.]|nr:hypothetical protein [Micavibrio sp.]|tara:strand:- start:2129 stop:3544 length:1416 start_codon:yes stop_codon:yes gene_type:complete
MSNTPNHSAHVKDMIEIATKREDQSYTESSKYINFFLTYECAAGNILDPLIADITKEVDASEWELEETPRKNKRANVPNRRFKAAVRSIILNVLQVHEIKSADVFLAVSRDANTYLGTDRYAPHDMGYDPFIDAFNGLIRQGYTIIEHEGYYDHREHTGSTTRIAASEDLLDLYKELKGDEHISFITRKICKDEKDETIILKGELPNRPKVIGKLQYKDNKFTENARNNLRRINKLFEKHQIKLDCDEATKAALMTALGRKAIYDTEQVRFIDESAVKLYRIFSDGQFNRGGRFYRGWWQQVPKDFRKYITIDGQPTVELDYSRYHISILYTQLGLIPEGDPYDIHPKVHKDVIKYAINAMLNAKSIVREHEDFNPDACGMTWEKLIKLIEDKHKPIVDSGRWNTGYGLTLQYIDSQIAEEIMLHFVKQKVPCLPIHDSFIVPKSYENELRGMMERVYRKHFNQSIQVKTK